MKKRLTTILFCLGVATLCVSGGEARGKKWNWLVHVLNVPQKQEKERGNIFYAPTKESIARAIAKIMDVNFYEQQTCAVRCRLQGEKSPIAIVKHYGHKSIQVRLNDSPSLQFVQALRLRMQCQKKFEAMYVRLENREPVKNLDTAISLREQEDFKIFASVMPLGLNLFELG